MAFSARRGLFFVLLCFICVEADVIQDASIGNNDQLNDRLVNIERLLQVSLKKNDELEWRIELLEEDNRHLKATIKLLGQETKEEEKGDGALEKEDHRHTPPDVLAKTVQQRKRSPKQRVAMPSGGVAFTARVGETGVRHYGAGQTIVYGTVVTNVGGAYHSETGIFLAPVDGVYVFCVMTMVPPSNAEYLEFVKNGRTIQATYAHGTGENRYESTSMTITLELKAGDEVWVRTLQESEYPHGNGVLDTYYSVLSGWLLAPWANDNDNLQIM